MADQAEKANTTPGPRAVKDLLQGKPTNGKVDELARLLLKGRGRTTSDYLRDRQGAGAARQ